MTTLRTVVTRTSGRIFPEIGEWCPLATVGGRAALLSCPRCGATGTVPPESIETNGTVVPSVWCPREGCGWHASVILDDWGPGE